MGQRPLEGIKVVEVSMWAFVPTAGALLAEWGASVTKIEASSGDPVRGLNYAGIAPGTGGFSLMYELFNRGKRDVAMDLAADGATELLYQMIETADVFLVSLLPSARRRLAIDVEDIRARNPTIIYAVGSGQGARGDDADQGGYDSISFWSRSGIASAVTPDDYGHPLPMPGGAFGDALSGAMLAAGVAAAVVQRDRTGEGCTVDVSLLGTAMWTLQPGIAGATLINVPELPKFARNQVPNPLVNSYRTADGRFVALCMLQGQRYWPGFCAAIGRPDLIGDPRFADDESRARNIEDCIAELDAVFCTRPLADWKQVLATQEGQWDVVQKAGELPHDRQAIANGYMQPVDYGDGRVLRMVSSPVQFDGAPSPIGPAPSHGAHSDEVMAELGLDEDQIIDLKIRGVLV
jgi:crotonobetainyl-CoA:carnitine CoA-transferase CaiB-like acyl-CoA transferase